MKAQDGLLGTLHATVGPAFAPAFARDRARSYGDPGAENALVHGENLSEAMTRLARAGFAGRFRCIYFDPPFNSGRRFAEYERRALPPDEWRAMMGERVQAARELLADDGAVFEEIDDTELGPLQVVMDGVYGREQRVSTITLVRSAATGHKAINRGPVNVTDFVLVYARERSRWRCNALVRDRASYDRAYGTWLENPGEACETWRFAPLTAHVRRVLGAVAGAERTRIERYAVDHAEHVVRFAQPRYEAVSQSARALIDRSRCEADRVFRLERPGRKDLLLRGGNRILFLGDKVVERAGRRSHRRAFDQRVGRRAFPGHRARRGRTLSSQQEAGAAHRADPGALHRPRRLGPSTPSWGAAPPPPWRTRWDAAGSASSAASSSTPCASLVFGASSTARTRPGSPGRSLGWKGGGGFHVLT